MSSATETAKPEVNVNPAIQPTELSNIQQDVNVMLHYATNSGLVLPPSLQENADNNASVSIANYNALLEVIKPATVESIKYIDQEIEGIGDKKKWYKINIFRKCIMIALASLIVLICVSLLPEVNAENQTESLLASSGYVLLVNLIFICSAALLGVMFYLLKTISDKIKLHTLLPIDSIELDATILIGVISGFIISELFAFTADTIDTTIEINKMTLALLGGFSSDAIFTMLQGIVNKFKLLLTPSTGTV